MFLDNKYTGCYHRIIADARANPPSGYSEQHHILPRCLGGNNAASNLVRLSAKQHYVCHLLLTKMVEGRNRSKMAWALHRMAFSVTGERKICTGTEYALARKLFSKLTRGVPKNNGAAISKALKGKKKSPEHRAALSRAMSGFTFSEERNQKIRRAHLGKKRAPFSDEHRSNISKSARTRPKPSEERNAKLSRSLSGKPKSKEHAQRIAESLKAFHQRKRLAALECTSP